MPVHRLVTAVIAMCLLGCAEHVEHTGGAPLEIEPVELGFTGATTPGGTAVTNLSAQIDGLSRLVDLHGADLYGAALVPLLLQRAQLLGAIDDVDAAARVASAISDPVARAQREAAVLSAAHEWDAALARLPAFAVERESIALARGEDASAILEARRARASAASTYRSETELALALSEAGLYDEADAAYLRALERYDDVSPFPIAFVQLQRGVMWAERAGRPGRAVELYREAVRRVPEHVSANVHLAELEVDLGMRDIAIARLRGVAAWSADPEPSAVLAALLAIDEPEEAERHRAIAIARYELLLSTHRLAYADHATELFLGAGGDPQRALTLALENLENRHTERAYDLAIRAAAAAGDPARACRLAEEIALDRPRTEPLRATLAVLAARCR
jgi:tetratricopeptide (TPR) repeat protein